MQSGTHLFILIVGEKKKCRKRIVFDMTGYKPYGNICFYAKVPSFLETV